MKIKLNEGKMFWVGMSGLIIWLILGCWNYIFWFNSPLWLLTILDIEKK